MTEEGMTISLHQKFTNVFNKDGLPIFELIFDLIKNAGDKKSVLQYLKAHESITTWCLYMSFKNGDILGVDILGKEIFANEFVLPENDILYFCNHLEDKRMNQEEMIPTGFHQYNVMREKSAEKKISRFLAKKDRSEIELIKMMATPYDQKIKHIGHYENYLMDTITPSSLTVMTLNPTAHSSHYIVGAAPKIFRDNLIVINDTFNNPTKKEIITKHKKIGHAKEDYYQGLSSLMKAQKGFDLRLPQEIYHHLQFAIDHLENHLEKGLAEFYFLIAQYIYEDHPKILMTLLHDFKKLEGHLPQTLNDHCLLFIGRLERILNAPNTLEEDKIIHPKLRSIYHFELTIPKLLLHFTTKSMMITRIDILDVVYIYVS
jgi:hypothetical protein